MNIHFLALALFGSLLIALVLGLPIAFCFGGIAVLFISFLLSPQATVFVTYARFMGEASSWLYTAIPLFIFMGVLLERSGIAEALYAMMYRWIGRLRGGLAMGTVLISTIMATLVGLNSAATIAMGIIALPSMLKRGYSKEIAIGSIAAGGTLGILIPPSVIMIIYGMNTATSIGRLWLGGFLPGLLLCTLFISYIGIRCYFQPHLGPPLPLEERVTWRDRFVSLRAVILPILLVAFVLGSFFTGMATPTEAAAVGAAGSILCAALNRRLTWQNLKEANYSTLKLTCMVFWIVGASAAFRTACYLVGSWDLFKNALLALPLGRWGVLIMMQFILIILGCFLDEYSILAITMPVFAPVIQSLGFDLVWFGILFVINMEMAYLTPPFALSIFYLKGVVPKDITMRDLYQSVLPFVAVQAFGLILVMIFPQIVLWLPDLAFR